jgi:hypothetical protein
MLILKKIFSSRTSTPISIKLGANHPWVKGISIAMPGEISMFKIVFQNLNR